MSRNPDTWLEGNPYPSSHPPAPPQPSAGATATAAGMEIMVPAMMDITAQRHRIIGGHPCDHRCIIRLTWFGLRLPEGALIVMAAIHPAPPLY
mmetsp:Transcript_30874/g.50410  ORF Transcript_30874/g.50410 Transcript_30874/m.50410 type:complete len:93 (+) Transcript_30874:44-322(+)